MATAFMRRSSVPGQVSTADDDKLHSKIGQLMVERDFFGRWLVNCTTKSSLFCGAVKSETLLARLKVELLPKIATNLKQARPSIEKQDLATLYFYRCRGWRPKAKSDRFFPASSKHVLSQRNLSQSSSGN